MYCRPFQHPERKPTINCGIIATKDWPASPLVTILIGSKLNRALLSLPYLPEVDFLLEGTWSTLVTRTVCC